MKNNLENLTENGIALAHIVIAADAESPIPYAAEEFSRFIKTVSGAEIPVVNAVRDGSLPVMIGTPKTNPELEALFPEDLAWLRVLSEAGKRWGSDGFAVRLHEGALYIFGATARGALNGVYDFIEKNTGMIWVRAKEDYGMVYTEMPTIPLTKVNYREKSPFEIRGWHLCHGYTPKTEPTMKMIGRNKINTWSAPAVERMGMAFLGVSHNVKNLVKNSPLYDPEEREYWNTVEDGSYGTYETSVQINFFSEKTAEAAAASIIERFKTGEKYPFVGIEDREAFGKNAHHDGVPFEYAPGKFVAPSEKEFEATVYFTFVNRIARRVKEVYPEGEIATFAYLFTEQPPLCEVEDNVCIVMAPITENLCYSFKDERSKNNRSIYEKMEEWRKKGTKMVFYNYYGCFKNGDYFTRPVWDRIKEHLSYYRDCGFYGLIPEGQGDDGSSYCWYHDHTENTWWNLPYEPAKADPNHYLWAMNGMIFWIYEKLSWNPDLDVDSLIVEFCDKVYGAASSAMQEYYRLMKLGWENGRDDIPFEYDWFTPEEYYEDAFLFNKKFENDPETANLMGRLLETLNTAWNLADNRGKENLRLMKERMEKIDREYVAAPRTPYGVWYDMNLMTNEGKCASHIVIGENAGEALRYAAEELALHARKVSGAEIPVVNKAEVGTNLPIILATPDTEPALEELFPEDLNWLRTLSEGGKRWGSDGFAVRRLEGRLYIFGVTERGVLNGTYDFIEKNMGVLWVRANEDYGTVYSEMPTIRLEKIDYREKSPFEVRGWHLCGGTDPTSPVNRTLISRNKINTWSTSTVEYQGLSYLGVSHNVKRLVKNSPIYDPEVKEYWNTLEDGSYGTFETTTQINFFSDKTAEAVAASVIERLGTGVEYPFIGIEDINEFGGNAQYDGKPFEYAPGQFVDPSEKEYHSTVYFTFVNKVARQVKKQVPTGKIATFAYFFTETPPKCELEDNVCIVMAPIRENLAFALDDTHSDNNTVLYQKLELWRAKGAKMVFYNYYGCFVAGDRYTRPIWDRIQEHLSYYRDCGFYGLLPEGEGDDGAKYWFYYTGVRKGVYGYSDYDGGKTEYNLTTGHLWALNGMVFWIYAKLCWNPDADVDALIKEFCDKVYGAASSAMQEYYRLVKLGWDVGRYDLPFDYSWAIGWGYHMDCFLFNERFEENPETANLMERILETVNTAWELADDRAKEHIRLIKERMETAPKEHEADLRNNPKESRMMPESEG